MTNPVKVTKATQSFLGKSIGIGSSLMSPVGAMVLERQDPVLRFLAHSDEREYRSMIRTHDAVSGAVEQRVMGLISQESEVVPGDSDSAASKLLFDFVVSALKRVPKMTTLRRELQQAIYQGWRPLERQWGPVSFKGRTYMAPTKVVAHDSWDFAITKDDQVVRLRPGRGAVLEDHPMAHFRWWVCTAGSTSSPYGQAWLQKLWLLYKISKEFEGMSAQAMKRSLGILKISQNGGAQSAMAAKQGKGLSAKTESELGGIVEALHSNNILWEKLGWTMEFLDQKEIPKSSKLMLEYFDERARIAIVGQNLTSKVSGGSFAAEQGHQKILESFWKVDAKEEAGWWNDGFIADLLAFNFGEVDPADVPKWRSKIFSKPDLDATKAFFDMGGPVDARRLASAYNIPAIFEPAEGDVVLGGSSPVDRALSGEAASRAVATPEDSAAIEAARRAGGAVEGELSTYYRSMADAFREANPDPKA